MKNKKGFTLVELLAVIVVLGIVMGIPAVAITNVLDSTRKNAFVSNAKQYIEGAKSIVEAELVDRMFATGDTTVLGTCAKDSTHNIAIKDTVSGDTILAPLDSTATESFRQTYVRGNHKWGVFM